MTSAQIAKSHSGSSDALRFAGYAAVFGTPDGARDTIMPGAFAHTLRNQSGRLPIYWQHRPEMQIGWAEMVEEDERGLRVIATVTNPASRAAAMLRSRAISGLSFGYRAHGFRHTATGRELSEIELFEISLVTHPLQHTARVHLVM